MMKNRLLVAQSENDEKVKQMHDMLREMEQ